MLWSLDSIAKTIFVHTNFLSKDQEIKMECEKTNILIILHKVEGDGGLNSGGDGKEVVGDELLESVFIPVMDHLCHAVHG